MKSLISTIMGQLREFFKKLSKKDKVRLFILAIVVIALAITTTIILGRTTYAELYTNLSPGTAGIILSALEEMGVDAKPRGSSTILVPEKQVDELRMRLAAENYTAGIPDLSILENANGFGVTDTVSKEYVTRQLEYEISQNILRSPKISDCTVKLVIPDTTKYSFSSSKIDASAAVTLTIRGGETLSNSEAKAIAETIMASVPGLTLDNIRIMDSNLKLYDIGEGVESAGLDANTQLALEMQAKGQLENQVENLLGRMFGDNAISVSVGLTLEFDDKVTESIELSPPVPGEIQGMVVSMMRQWENSRYGAAAEGAPGTDTNGMGADTSEYPYGTLEDDELWNSYLEEYNYDMNKLTTQIKHAKGTIKTLSIAIALDEEIVTSDYIAPVRDLVAKSIGVRDGDISVQLVPFVDVGTESSMSAAEYAKIQNQREVIEKIIMWSVILLLGLSIISLIRFIIRNLTEKDELEAVYAGGVGGIDYIAGDDEEFTDLTLEPEIELTNKSSNVEQLEKFIDKDSRAVAQLLRNWLSED